MLVLCFVLFCFYVRTVLEHTLEVSAVYAELVLETSTESTRFSTFQKILLYKKSYLILKVFVYHSNIGFGCGL